MKKVFVMAYTKFNLGDDLFIKILSERYIDSQFILYVPKKYKKVFKENKNIKIFSSDAFINRGINYLLRFLFKDSREKRLKRKVDAIVHIGGSIFMENNNWKRRQLIRENLFEKPYYIIGANFGPYKSDEFYQSYKSIFENYTDISFRDTYSYNLFKEMSNVRLADDVVFNLTPKVQKTEKSIVISVIKPSYRRELIGKDDQYYSEIKELIEEYTNKGYQVTLMSFCKHEGDLEAINSIKKLLSNKSKVNYFSYEDNIDDALNIIAKSEVIIATRFHAMILGWLYNKPTLPIAYSKKMTNVMNDVGYNGMYIDFTNLEDLRFNTVYEDLKTNSVNISKQITNSEKHFKKLDEFLEGNNY